MSSSCMSSSIEALSSATLPRGEGRIGACPEAPLGVGGESAAVWMSSSIEALSSATPAMRLAACAAIVRALNYPTSNSSDFFRQKCDHFVSLKVSTNRLLDRSRPLRTGPERQAQSTHAPTRTHDVSCAQHHSRESNAPIYLSRGYGSASASAYFPYISHIPTLACLSRGRRRMDLRGPRAHTHPFNP